MSVAIKTTGDLRRFLAKTITDVSEHKVSVDEASRIVKLAAQLNENFYAEVKVARLKKDLSLNIPDVGGLPIG